MHEKKKHLYSRRVLDIEQGSFTSGFGLYKNWRKGRECGVDGIKMEGGGDVPKLCHVIRTIKICTAFVLEALEAKRTIQRDTKEL